VPPDPGFGFRHDRSAHSLVLLAALRHPAELSSSRMVTNNLAESSTNTPSRRGGLLRKYVIVFVLLVSGALLTSGLVEAYFAYGENQATVIRLQREQALTDAAGIEQLLRETERLLGWVVVPEPGAPPTPAQRRADFARLLELAPALQAVSYLDGAGQEQLRV